MNLFDNKCYYCLYYSEKNMDYVWIGLSDQNNEGTFEWYINHKSKYTNWYRNEPDNYDNNEDCVYIYRGGGFWFDYDCDYIYLYYICEIS